MTFAAGFWTRRGGRQSHLCEDASQEALLAAALLQAALAAVHDEGPTMAGTWPSRPRG